jgi:hypothetical protein
MTHPTARTALLFTIGIAAGLLPTLADARLWPGAVAYLLLILALQAMARLWLHF